MKVQRSARLIAAALGGLILAGATTGIAVAVETSSSVNSSTSDAVVKTTAGTNLSATGRQFTVIESFKLPKGSWVLHADQTTVNFGPSDYVRCVIANGATSLDGHSSLVGDGTQSDNNGPGTFASTMSETGSVTLTSGSEISVQCEHDHSNGSVPSVDPDAALWAHRATGLVQLTTP
jgi:hypothetical protein